jgi:dimethylhistidine N-methyltransferase
MIPADKTNVQFHDFHPEPGDLVTEVLEGLSQSPKSVPPKFFYDENGSRLFNEITGLEEYYLTKTEKGILREKGREIGGLIGSNSVLIEYGCGNSEKIHLLLDHLQKPHTYVAIDISRDPLLDLTGALARSYPRMDIHAVCADYTAPLTLPLNGEHRGLRRVAFFPGSSIGNFEPEAAREFLNTIAGEVGAGGGLLVGVDLKKDEEVLNSAYNDGHGVTARFNKNVLKRINRECHSDFALEYFRHRAFYNREHGRIEMHLLSLKDHTVRIKDTSIHFKTGETIHTENSYKYSIEEFRSLAADAGWKPIKTWSDKKQFFSLHYLER